MSVGQEKMGPRIREDKSGGVVFTPIQTFPRQGGRVGRGIRMGPRIREDKRGAGGLTFGAPI